MISSCSLSTRIRINNPNLLWHRIWLNSSIWSWKIPWSVSVLVSVKPKHSKDVGPKNRRLLSWSGSPFVLGRWTNKTCLFGHFQWLWRWTPCIVAGYFIDGDRMEVYANITSVLLRLEASIMLWLRVRPLEINMANSSRLFPWGASHVPNFRGPSPESFWGITVEWM